MLLALLTVNEVVKTALLHMRPHDSEHPKSQALKRKQHKPQEPENLEFPTFKAGREDSHCCSLAEIARCGLPALGLRDLRASAVYFRNCAAVDRRADACRELRCERYFCVRVRVSC